MEPILKRLRQKLNPDQSQLGICLDGDCSLRGFISTLEWNIDDLELHDIHKDQIGTKVFSGIELVFYSDLRLKLWKLH